MAACGVAGAEDLAAAAATCWAWAAAVAAVVAAVVARVARVAAAVDWVRAYDYDALGDGQASRWNPTHPSRVPPPLLTVGQTLFS